MVPAQLAKEVKALSDEGWAVELVESDGMVCTLFHSYPLPRGYCRQSTDLLLRLPLSYPNGKPDMFWVEPDVLLVNGAVPKAAKHIETHLNRQWRRFSWHIAAWNPATDDLRTYIEVINTRLAKAI